MRNPLDVQVIEVVDVSNAIAWLASDEARYVTAVALAVSSRCGLAVAARKSVGHQPPFCAAPPISMARTSPMAGSRLAGSGSGRCAWIW